MPGNHWNTATALVNSRNAVVYSTFLKDVNKSSISDY